MGGVVGQVEWCGKWKCIHAHVFINPARVCLLVGAFNRFTFRVIINIYDPVIIFLIVLDLFSVGLFLLLCLLPREVPLAFVVKLIGWCRILFNFCLSIKLLISPSNLNKVLLSRLFLVIGSSLSSLWIYHAIPFWLVEFLLRNQLRAWWEFPCMLFVIFPLLLLIFSLCL